MQENESKMKKNREKFYFFRSYFDAIVDFSDKNFDEICGKIVKYTFIDDYKPVFKSKKSEQAWKLIKPFLDSGYKQFKNGSRNSGS